MSQDKKRKQLERVSPRNVKEHKKLKIPPSLASSSIYPFMLLPTSFQLKTSATPLANPMTALTEESKKQ